MARVTIFSLALALTAVTGLFGQTKEDCLACHSDKTATMDRKGKTLSIYVNDNTLSHSTHKKLVCVACHTGFDAGNLPHKEKITPVQCVNCHRNADAKHAFHGKVVATGSADESQMCKGCHGRHEVQSPKRVADGANPTGTELCAQCHEKNVILFRNSAHGKALAAGTKNAPTCVQCHSKNISSIPAGGDAAKLKLVQEQVCIGCHGSKVQASTGTTSTFVMAYEESFHAKTLRAGNGKAATCVDCHGSHEMKKGSASDSRVNRKNIPATCGQCHTAIADAYRGSIHGKGFAAGNSGAPVCVDCHGEHRILNPKDPNAAVSKLHVSADVCTPCHSSVRLSEKYGLASERGRTFDDSYHGLATKAGSVQVANCASCHGFHDILPSKDPNSRVNKNNLIQTCGRCHPGANQNFTNGAVHVIVESSENRILHFVTSSYIVLIVVTIGGMFVHNVLDFVKKSKRRLRMRRGSIEEDEVGHALFVRMSLFERIQHAMLLLSFITLVITGFMLKFPDAWWVQPIRSMSPVVFEVRSILHRLAAVVLIFASVVHIYYILFVPRGKQLVRDLLPRFQDAKDMLAVAQYNLGISKVRPKFDRFGYIEKSEYWALVWGTIVMGVTGFILWFDNSFLGIIGKSWWDVARTVHYYEAWLATLSIIVWHFYFVIFNPDVYPINLAFLKGTITEEEMHDEHPLELQRLKEQAVEQESASSPGSGEIPQ
ncbi:MAG: cytochrome c3 family protein [Ignavibacteriales bacterium]|nr:cytochrome c3 family protein [Ignavibacteriales bacterium]